MKLQRQKAPAGGAIVNRTFFKGGRFMTRAFRSVRAVADALRQLSRRPQNKSEQRTPEQLKAAIEEYMNRKGYTNPGGFYRLLADKNITPNFETGMTLGALRALENHLSYPDEKAKVPGVNALDPKDWLSNKSFFENMSDDAYLSAAKPKGYKIEHVLPFLSAVQNARIPAQVIEALQHKKTPDETKALLLAALMSEENGLFIQHKSKDPAAAGSEWYRHAMNPLDVAFHTRFAKKEKDPNWGEVDWTPEDKRPRLKYNGKPVWEHAPHQVLAKAVTAFTSGGKDPEANALVADKIIDIAHQRAENTQSPNWVNFLPENQKEELQKWTERVRDADKITGQNTKINPSEGLNGAWSNLSESAKWQRLLDWSTQKNIRDNNKQGGRNIRGFKSTPVYVVGDKVVAIVSVGDTGPATKFIGADEAEKSENAALYNAANSQQEKLLKPKKVTLPLVDNNGNLQPKAWGTQENVIENLRDLQRVVKHFETEKHKDPMRAAAEFLLTPQKVSTLRRILHIDLGENVHQPELYEYAPGGERTRQRDRDVNLGYLEPDSDVNRNEHQVPGSWLFGPKFGPFLQNIHANTPVPPNKNEDYFTQWDTQDVWRARGHAIRTGDDPMRGVPRERERKTLWNSMVEMVKGQKAAEAEKGEQGRPISVAGEQAVDWLATKHLLDLFGLAGTKADYIDGANAILKRAGHGRLKFASNGTLTDEAAQSHKDKPLKFDPEAKSRGALTEPEPSTPNKPAKPAKPAKLMRAPDPRRHDTPTRLARVISYVGGDPVPGAQRAIGVWDGGAERSNVVETDPERAAALAAQNRQKSALWFEPGPGEDSLHVFTHPGTPAEARALLNKHGVTYATLVPGRRGTQVHVVDPGGEFDGVLPGRPQKGKATFRRL